MIVRHDGRSLFVTLTMPQTNSADLKDAWLKFSRRFTLFWKRLKRALPRLARKSEYAWVLEPHKSGWPHLHLVIAGLTFIGWRKVSACWKAVGGASVDVQRVRGDVGRYMSDYLTKQAFADDDLADWLTDNRVRWYNQSHTRDSDKKAPSSSLIYWRVVPATHIFGTMAGATEEFWQLQIYSIHLLGLPLLEVL